MIDTLRFEVVLHLVQFLNVVDSSHLAETSKRFYYLVQQYRKLRGPEIAINACANHLVKPGTRLPIEQLYKAALDKLQTKPNLVLHFSTGLSSSYRHLPSLVPKDAVILNTWNEANESYDENVWRGDIQSNINGNIETSSENGIVLMCLPNTQIKSFIVAFEDDGEDFHPNTGDELFNELVLEQEENERPENWWKCFILFKSSETDSHADFEDFARRLQIRFPHAAIVGGVCEHCERHHPIHDDEPAYGFIGGSGVIVGVALGGGDNVPIQVRSVVSRGSRTTMHGDMDGPASIQDLESRLTNMSATLQENGEEILGTLMFSSGRRGPLTRESSEYSYGHLPYMRGEFMSDAKRFDDAFKHETAGGKAKHVPCLGLYSHPMGEVGIASMVGQDAIVQSGEDAMQYPIVVFALFVVPRLDTGTMIPHDVDLDDSNANAEEYFARSHTN